MMMRKKSNPWARAKYLYVLPLAAVAVAAFARPEISEPLNEISRVKVTEFPAISDAVTSESIEKADTLQGKPTKIVIVGDKDKQDEGGEASDSTKVTFAKEKKPLILVDGKEYAGDINAIDPNTIEQIDVWKDPLKTAPYGKKGKFGVILITTKKK